MKRLALLLLCPAAVGAQSRYALTPYVAQNNALPDAPTLYGASLTAYEGVVGMRLGAGARIRSSTDAAGVSTVALRAWTADADLVLAPAQLPGVSWVLGGFSPAAYVGLGAQGVLDPDGRRETRPVLSYGALVSRRILGGLGVETEARYRIPFSPDSSALPAGFARGWEYRAGLSLRFGGSSGPSRRRGSSVALPRLPAPAVRLPAPIERGRRAGRGAVTAGRVLATADGYVGTRYTYGGTTPGRGFDCSGFVQYVFSRHDVSLPRTSRQMAEAGRRLAPAVRALRPGDLMLFAQDGRRIDHVAIYAGDNRIIHSSASSGGVRYDDLSTARGRWFAERLVAARRVVADGRSLVEMLDAAALAVDETELDPPDRGPMRQ